MTSWGFGWRSGVLAFALLSLLAAAAGLVAVQFDDQYEQAGILGRLFVGAFGGLFSAALASPVTAVVAAGAGGLAGLHRRRLLRDKRRVAASRGEGDQPPA
jgi:hypothetical protein